MSNPLIDNPNQTPDFQAVKPEHFLPAIDAAYDESMAIVDEIKNCDDLPTFENTIEPLEKTSRAMSRIFSIYGAFYSNKSSKAIEELYQPLSRKAQKLTKEIFQDDALAARFKSVYDARDTLGLDDEQIRVLQELYGEFEESGTLLSPADREELNTVDEAMIDFCAQYKSNLAASTNQQAFIVSQAETAGIPEDTLASMEENFAQAIAGISAGAKDADKEFYEELSDEVKQHLQTAGNAKGYLFVPERLAIDTLLGIAEDRGFREKIFNALNNTGTEAPYTNEAPIRLLQEYRQKRVEILNRGRPQNEQYKDYTDYALSKTMAGSLAAVEALFDEIEAPLLKRFEEEIQTLTEFAAENGQNDPLEPWDVPFWTERYKKETWGYDSKELSEYLEVGNVIEGFIDHASELFNIRFEENKNYSTISDDVRAFDIYDDKGGYIGILHMDLFARTGKRGGAWATTYQSATDGKPVISAMNCNLPKPAAGKPALVDPVQVTTFFHEAGHSLNMLLGTRSRYPILHGTSAHASDFTEQQAMVQERWAFEREVLKRYAKHYKTGAAVPDALIEAKLESESFMADRQPLLIIQNARRDFLFHSTNPSRYRNTADIHEKAKLDSPVADMIRPYPLTRFDHLFSSPQSSYAAGYYSYLWADTCAADLFSFFKDSSLYDTARGVALREFYADGCARTTHETFNRFAGRAPSTSAFRKEYGIDTPAAHSSEPDNKPKPS
ncbi:MAG TPA: hypothetical protein EYG18_04570 [Micavibrio sp.]|nr:hypothetical protein [Micavibrio sp.]HIL28526.1 hypothetical protein [Micavibrio sp.]